MLIEKVHAFSKTWLAKILFVLIIISFTFVGVQGVLFQSVEDAGEVVRVDGATVNMRQFNDLLRAEMRAFGQQEDLQSLPTEIQQRIITTTLEKAVRRAALASLIDDSNLAVDKAVIETQLLNNSRLHDEQGNFSAALLRQVLVNNNISESEFVHDVDQNTLINWFANSLVNASILATPAVHIYYDALHEKRSGSYIAIDPITLAVNLTPTTKEITDYYNAHKSTFLTQARLRVDYISLNTSDMTLPANAVSAQEVWDAYEQYANNAQANRIYDVRHILLTEDKGEVDIRSQQVAQVLASGMPFAEVAQAFSDDELTAENGGALGEITLDLLPEALQTVLASMEVGQWTEQAVVSDLGAHFVFLESVEESIRPFADMREEIRKQLIQQAQRTQLQEIYTQLEERAYLSDTVASLATTAGTQQQTSAWITNVADNNNEAFAKNTEVLAALFAPEFLQATNPTVMQTTIQQEDTLLVMQVHTYEPSKEAPLADVKQAVTQAVQLTQANQIIGRALTQAIEFANRIHPKQVLNKQALTAIAQKISKETSVPAQWEPFTDVERFDATKPPQLMRALFSGSRTLWQQNKRHMVATSDDTQAIHYLVYVNAITAPTLDSISEQERQLFDEYVANVVGQDILSMWLANSIQSKDVVINTQLFQVAPAQ